MESIEGGSVGDIVGEIVGHVFVCGAMGLFTICLLLVVLLCWFEGKMNGT